MEDDDGPLGKCVAPWCRKKFWSDFERLDIPDAAYRPHEHQLDESVQGFCCKACKPKFRSLASKYEAAQRAAAAAVAEEPGPRLPVNTPPVRPSFGGWSASSQVASLTSVAEQLAAANQLPPPATTTTTTPTTTTTTTPSTTTTSPGERAQRPDGTLLLDEQRAMAMAMEAVETQLQQPAPHVLGGMATAEAHAARRAEQGTERRKPRLTRPAASVWRRLPAASSSPRRRLCLAVMTVMLPLTPTAMATATGAAPVPEARPSPLKRQLSNLTRQLRRERTRRREAEGEVATARAALAMLVEPRRSSWRAKHSNGPPCNASRHIERPLVSAIVQTFADGSNARLLAARLHALPRVEVIINDDSGRDHEQWLRWFRGSNDFVVTSPNVHEIRAYDRLARMARGTYLLLLQGDHCPPRDAGWLLEGLALFVRFPRLALLGGQMGFDEVPLRKIAESVSWGIAPCRPIPYRVPPLHAVGGGSDGSDGAAAAAAAEHADIANASGCAGVPFMFVAGVNIGPLLVRREAFLRVGGFDESFSCAGEPGIQLDMELSLALWRAGYQVGLWDSAVTNGVGGRKTRANPEQKRLRVRNDAVNGQRCKSLLRWHDGAAVATANRLLEPIGDASGMGAAATTVSSTAAAAALRERHQRERGLQKPEECGA